MSRSALDRTAINGNAAHNRLPVAAAPNQWSVLAQSGISAIMPAAVPHYNMQSLPLAEQEEEIPPDQVPIHGNQETGYPPTQ